MEFSDYILDFKVKKGRNSKLLGGLILKFYVTLFRIEVGRRTGARVAIRGSPFLQIEC